MDKFKEIRPIVLGVVKKHGKILVQEGYKKDKDQYYYRCLGGGIEFLERAEEALKREFKEELGIEVIVGDYIGFFQNIFEMDGKPAHELVFIYEIKLPKELTKVTEVVPVAENENPAKWIPIQDFVNHKRILYPEGMIKYL